MTDPGAAAESTRDRSSVAVDEFGALLMEDFAPLFADDDVSEARVSPDGTLTITRRGRSESIDAKAGDLAAAAFAATEHGRLHALLYRAGHSAAAARLDVTRVNNGVHLFLEQRARTNLPLSALEDSGVIPEGMSAHLTAHASGGGDVVALGPSRYASHQLIGAVADGVAAFAPTFVVTGQAVDADRAVPFGAPEDASRHLIPFAFPAGAPSAVQFGPNTGSLLENAKACVDVGAVFLAAVDLSPAELKSLLEAKLSAVLLVQLRASAFDFNAVAADVSAATSCVFGFGARGQPCLSATLGVVEDNAARSMPSQSSTSSGRSRAQAHFRPPLRDGAPSTVAALPTDSSHPSSLGSSSAALGVRPDERDVASAATATSTAPPSPVPMVPPFGGPDVALPPLRPLGPAPPTNWMSDAPEMDPGWDIKSDSKIDIAHVRAQVEAASGSIDEKARRHALLSDEDADERADSSEHAPVVAEPNGGFQKVMNAVAERPAFKPKKPSEHPQAKKLREDPFGGLTFEPPRDPAAQANGDDDTALQDGGPQNEDAEAESISSERSFADPGASAEDGDGTGQKAPSVEKEPNQ